MSNATKFLPTIPKMLLSAESKGNRIRQIWDALHHVPGGTRLFSAFVGRMAPYTGSIGAHVEELRCGFARVTLPDRPKVRNHLRSVHAVALVNLAELAGNIALAYSLPDDARFIVAGLEIEYLKKARGTITATSEAPTVESNQRDEYLVPVRLNDAQGVLVAQATLRTLVGPKRAS
ncbi:MAG: hotdog fold domain-containing protein [Myxococcota bacterium]